MKKIITLLAAIPILAFFGGVGILSYRIGETWDETTTQSLVTGLTVVCGGGTLVFAILLACLIGIPLAIRTYGEGGSSQRKWNEAWSDRRPTLSPDDDWHSLPAKRPSPVIDGYWQTRLDPTPPWGMTGGGNTQLLPPVEQDERFGVERFP